MFYCAVRHQYCKRHSSDCTFALLHFMHLLYFLHEACQAEVIIVTKLYKGWSARITDKKPQNVKRLWRIKFLWTEKRIKYSFIRLKRSEREKHHLSQTWLTSTLVTMSQSVVRSSGECWLGRSLKYGQCPTRSFYMLGIMVARHYHV